MKLRILIVDDEPLGVKVIRDLLASEPEVEVVGECLNGHEAVQAIRTLRPDLVFLDIQMPGLDGFQVLEELDEAEMPLVVFVTAYDQFSLQAFEVHALDYLLKPASVERFQAALARAWKLIHSGDRQDLDRRLYALLEQVEVHRPRGNRFVVREGERVHFIKAEDVEAIEATRNYMHLHIGRTSHMIRESLANLERKLDPRCFVRTHRSWIVNLEQIQEIRPWERGAFLLTTKGGTEVPVSSTFREGIDQLIRTPLV